jgi:hypothetical protein
MIDGLVRDLINFLTMPMEVVVWQLVAYMVIGAGFVSVFWAAKCLDLKDKCLRAGYLPMVSTSSSYKHRPPEEE